MKEKFIPALLERKITKTSFKQPIKFKVGIRSPIYGDYRSVFAYPELRDPACDLIDAALEGIHIDVVYGVSEGALSPAAVYAYRRAVEYGFIRKDAKLKDYGLQKLTEGADVSGKDVLLIEDLITTGSSVISNAKILKKMGANSVHIVALFSYEFPIAKKEFQEAELEYKPLITIDDVMPYIKLELSAPDYDNLLDFVKEPYGWFDRHKMEFEFGFLTDLRMQAEENQSIICLGADPVIEALPKELPRGVEGFGKYMDDLLFAMDARAVHPGMIKPNLGFYQIHDNPWNGNYAGSNTLAGIMRTWTHEGFLVTLDSKTGDIGKSSANYAQIGHHNWGASAVTIHGYMGDDSVEPYTKYCNHGGKRGVYILVKTSNPGSANVQMKKLADGRYVYELMGENIINWAKGKPGVGAVVGGNSLEELFAIAKMFAGKDIPLLIPGVGAQGGSAKEVAQVLREAGFELALARINSSSGITHPWYKKPGDLIPSYNECIEISINALQGLNKEVGYKTAA